MPDIPQSEWKWFGKAGHYIYRAQCRFHLCTQVGKFLISTIGERFKHAVKEMQELGPGRFYETIVFRAEMPICQQPDCECEMPGLGDEVDSYTNAKTAGQSQESHFALCRKWSEEIAQNW